MVITTLFQQRARRPALSWAATLAALTAFVTLMLTYSNWEEPNNVLLCILIGILLVLSLTRWHLPKASWAHWVMRLALFVPIVLENWDKLNDPQTWLFDTTAVGAFGILASAEFVTQVARTMPVGQSNSGALCLLSGYVFLAACTTDQIWPIRIASPIYFAFAVLSLPRFEIPRHHVSGSETRTRVLAIISALVLGAGIYSLFWIYRVPLMQIGAGSLHDRPITETTGLSSQPILGPRFGLQGSLQRVLRLQNAYGQSYLRGIAYDTYNHGRWEPVLDRRHLAAYSAVGTQAPAPPGSLRITTLAPVQGLLFVPLSATSLSLPSGGVVSVQQDLRNGGFHLHLGLPPPYAVGFGASGVLPLLRTSLTPEERTRDLAVPPEVDPHVSALARQITRDTDSPAAKAAAVQQFFLQNFHYSLVIHPGPGDPVSNFILGRQSAHCEFFASGAVLMLRAAGLPARYVTGYYAHENISPGITLVRQQDAHAWAEVWLGSQGWATLDATPADGRPPATAAAISWTQRASEWLSDRLTALRAWVGQFTTGQIVGSLVVIALLYWGIRKLWQRWHRVPSSALPFAYAPSAEMDALAQRFENWLARIGLPCPLSVPWAEHVQATGLADALPFVQYYNAARFGPPLSLQAHDTMEREISRLEQTKHSPLPLERAAA